MRSEVALTLLVLGVCGAWGESRYLGRELGALSELHHGVKGTVYAVDSRTLFIKDFHYDGEGPAAYFYVGSSKAPSASGATRLRDERGGTSPIRRYRGEGVTLSLPDGITLKDVKWFFVWCDEYSVNFGDVRIPRELEYPRPAKVGALRGVHGVSSDAIVVVDAQTLLIPNFSYDGEAPDAKFWVGRGASPSPQGIRIPDENGKEMPLRKYDKKTIVLTLPGELTVFDIGHFAVWCEAFTVNFGHVPLPRAQLENVPPSLKMLGVSPQSKLNCEVLYDELAFEVRWAVAGDSIVFQLVAKLEDGEYMSFGISGDETHSQMVGGDVSVAWVDKQTLKGFAYDYYLDAKSQCAGVRGSCPDERLGENTNSIRLLNAALVNGYSIVTYQRSLKAADELDRAVLTNGSQPIIWAIGPLNSRNEVSYHSHFTKGDKLIEFGRPPVWNCPMPEGEDEPPAEPAKQQHKPQPADEPKKQVIRPNPVPTPKPVPAVSPWDIPAVQCHEPADGVFYAQMGPTGGKQGYSAITGHVGWGISWYINGLLIPEINVVRGKKYTFVVEGGSDPSVPARYHPFYITNDSVGGYYHKSDKEKEGVEIYAGVRRTRSGDILPSGVGRLCNWTPDTSGPEADEFPSFGAYQRSLTLVCEEGNPGVVTWIPDRKTPDTVYYQCFTHRHLGWKINVLDECDASEAEESRVVEQVVAPDDDLLEGEESIQVQTRVKPDDNFLDQRRKVEKIINTKNDFSSDKGEDVVVAPQRNQLEPGQEYELPITKGQIKEVIETVESLESKIKEDMRNSNFSIPSLTQYQVSEDINEFLPEQPVREGDEYIVEPGKLAEIMLPPSQKPLTLQSVMRPNGKPMGNMRPPFRRPVPPEIKLYSSPYHKNNGGSYPLPMPNPHTSHGPPKKPYPNKQNNRPPNMNRPTGTLPMKPMPPMHQHHKNNKPHFNHGPPKTVPKPHNGPGQNMQKPQNGPLHNNMPKPSNGPVPYNIGKPTNNVPNNLAKPSTGLTQQQNYGNSNNVQKPPIGPVYTAPKQKSGPVQSIIMGKPIGAINVPPQSQTLSLGRTDIIANQVVKSIITLPGNVDSLPQHSAPPQTFLSRPGQIILGKPMDNPVPLDQQMSPSRQITRSPPTPAPESHPSSTLRIRVDPEYPQQPSSAYNDIKSSDFMGETKDVSTLNPAINTGFKPESIVVESGFKPIIREPLMAGEDRIADYDDNKSTMNRREDTDVEENYDDAPQYISNHAFSPSDKITETFEPMFIPSPQDHLLPTNDRTKEIFPSNHAKEDRPHPVYVKTESELNALFSKKNMEKEVPSDMVMEADRVSPQYLPPVPKITKIHSQKLSDKEDTYTTYDGKTVSAATLTSVDDIKTKHIFSSKLPSNSEFLLKTPQFGPFKGDIPPIVAEEINKEKPNPVDTRTTHLKLVNLFNNEESSIEDLKPEASEVHEKEANQKYNTDPKEKEEQDYAEDEDNEEYEEDEEDEDSKVRNKRDTKTTQFERSVVEEQSSTEGKIVINNKNQVDFQHSEAPGASTANKFQWSLRVALIAAVFLTQF